jgi:hypothetical protein
MRRRLRGERYRKPCVHPGRRGSRRGVKLPFRPRADETVLRSSSQKVGLRGSKPLRSVLEVSGLKP